jgi:sodium transport system permease protein
MIFTVFKKEMIDTLRDRRTLITMIVIPILIFPLILSFTKTITKSAMDKAANKIVTVGIVDSEGTFKTSLSELPKKIWKMNVKNYSDSSQMKKAIAAKKCDFGFSVSSSYQANLKSGKTGQIAVLFKASDVGFEERAKKIVDHFTAIEMSKRLTDLKLQQAQLTPVVANYRNLASTQEMIGKLAGGILPYMFVIFGFIGCMYPAIDLFTGEKERGTIETLLTAPIKRWQILLGKMLVVVVSGVAAGTFALIGLAFSIGGLDSLGIPELSSAAKSIISFEFIVVIYLLLIPLMVFFAGILIPIAIYAKSFKEAQSLITPLNIVIILPAMIGLMPGFEYNIYTACIPIVNIVMATKELVAGTLNYGLLAVSFSVMTLLAVAVVLFCQKQYSKETNIIQ